LGGHHQRTLLGEPLSGRDRDDAGRPLNARPRDALGRPLPYGSRGVPRLPDDVDSSPADSLAHAQDLLDRGLAFNAHEVLEAAWKSSPADEKPLWQGLAQLAVGITHVQRGNVGGAMVVLRRAADRLGAVGRPVPHGVDVPRLIDHAAGLVRDLDASADISADRLRPSLTTAG
jgi:predicted metal-dependent hydrolase